MATLTDRFRGMFAQRDRVKPMTEQGVPGFAIYGGYIATPESNNELHGALRWVTAADIIANTSIVAASLRYTLNLISRPHWRFDPPDDSAEAKAMAEFAEEVVNDLDTSWTRTVRRAGMFRFHGFGIHEWVGKRREDGRIGLASLEVRPQHTIERWDIDNSGSVIGVWQRDPQTGEALYLPRQKLLYLVDDTLTDRPDGQGWFRHLVEPARRMKSLLELEAIGFERDLAGIPMGRAPIGHLQKLLTEEKISQAQYDTSIRALSDMVKVKRKSSQTGMILDSATYLAKSETGESVSAVPQWDLQLLTGTQNSIEALGASILRLAEDMAMIMGTESMLVGRGGEGSRALSEDKSRNLYLTANATLADMAEGVDRDIVDRIWALNGLDEKLKPKAAVEDVAFKDAESIARVLNEMASAGAVLAPDDPAINDLRDLMGIEHASPLDMTMVNALQGRGDPTKPSPEAELNDARAREAMDREDKRVANDNKGQAPPGKTRGAANARKAKTATLYVHRPLLNADALIEWAKANGFETTLPADDMHVTVAFSRDPLDWDEAGDSFDTLRVTGGDRALGRLGKDGEAVALKFYLSELADRWQEFRDAGASWDWPEYQPHITLSYNAGNLDLDAIEPFDGPLEFGPEVFEEVKENWSDGVTEKGFNPNQPRDPAGQATGGRWTAADGKDPMESEDFRRWFGESKVVDENGDPLVVYHGSVERDLDTFDTDLVTTRGKGDAAGTYFTDDAMSASNYTRVPIAERVGDLKTKRGSVYAAYLSLQNPLDTTDAIAGYQKDGLSFGDAKRKALTALDRGVHDGIMFRGDDVNPKEFVAFRSSQIKSIRNEGTFNPADDSIFKGE